MPASYQTLSDKEATNRANRRDETQRRRRVVAASRIARSSEPPSAFTRSMSVYGRSLKSSGKWNHYPAQRQEQRQEDREERHEASALPVVGKVRNSRPLKIAIRIKFTR